MFKQLFPTAIPRRHHKYMYLIAFQKACLTEQTYSMEACMYTYQLRVVAKSYSLLRSRQALHTLDEDNAYPFLKIAKTRGTES